MQAAKVAETVLGCDTGSATAAAAGVLVNDSDRPEAVNRETAKQSFGIRGRS